MTIDDQKRLEAIQRKSDRFNFGKSVEISSDYRFLLGVISGLQQELAKLKADAMKVTTRATLDHVSRTK